MSEDISSHLGGVTQTISGNGNYQIVGNGNIHNDSSVILRFLSIIEAQSKQIAELQAELLKYKLKEIETTK